MQLVRDHTPLSTRALITPAHGAILAFSRIAHAFNFPD